jgi:hypothetical protein
MRLSFRLKHRFFNAFREIFVHHHGSLAFRAKIFALIIAANDDYDFLCYDKIKSTALDIYKDDKERAQLLMISTKELVDKVHEKNGLDVDSLIDSIVKDLKYAPRYAKKIEIKTLTPILELTHDEDTLSYQKNILEFLEKLKNETINSKKDQIEIAEKSLIKKY